MVVVPITFQVWTVSDWMGCRGDVSSVGELGELFGPHSGGEGSVGFATEGSWTDMWGGSALVEPASFSATRVIPFLRFLLKKL